MTYVSSFGSGSQSHSRYRTARPSPSPPPCSVDVVGDEQRHASPATVDGGGLDRGPEVLLRGHVVDGVMGEHRVELPSQPQRAHVALDVLAVGIQLPADLEHRRRHVGQRHGEVALEVRGVVASAAAQLEHPLQPPGGAVAQEAAVDLRLLDVVLGRGEEREPSRQVAVQAGSIAHGRSGARSGDGFEEPGRSSEP
jgi:hypothetical protein